MSQIININRNDLSDLESIAGSKTDLNINKEADLFDLATDIDQN